MAEPQANAEERIRVPLALSEAVGEQRLRKALVRLSERRRVMPEAVHLLRLVPTRRGGCQAHVLTEIAEERIS